MNESNLVVEDLVPVGARVLLSIYKKPENTADGFILPESENSGMPALGTITVLGKKTLWQKILIVFGFRPRYTVGQSVYFRKYSVDELRMSTPSGELVLFVLEENEIIGIIDTR